MERAIQGLIAALLTPLAAEGDVNLSALRSNVEFVRQEGGAGVCVLGATGEYARVPAHQRDRIVTAARDSVGSDGLLICGAGSCRLDDSVQFARRALELGADAILLPPPAFFPCDPDDVEAFYLEAARQIDGRILLYNLPSFVTPIAQATALRVFEGASNVVGLKDSSGSLDLLEATRDRFGRERTLIPGNDAVIGDAIDRGVCDAVISGIAGVWPELLLEVAQSKPGGGASARDLLRETVALVNELPTPWALYRIALARGFSPGQPPLPASKARASQILEIEARLERMLPSVERRSA